MQYNFCTYTENLLNILQCNIYGTFVIILPAKTFFNGIEAVYN